MERSRAQHIVDAALGVRPGMDVELTSLFEEHNMAGPDRTDIPATLLKVTVTNP